MTPPKLTGRKRHRIHKPFLSEPLFVLQVEVKGTVTTSFGGIMETTQDNWWIDAKAEHLTIEPKGY